MLVDLLNTLVTAYRCQPACRLVDPTKEQQGIFTPSIMRIVSSSPFGLCLAAMVFSMEKLSKPVLEFDMQPEAANDVVKWYVEGGGQPTSTCRRRKP